MALFDRASATTASPASHPSTTAATRLRPALSWQRAIRWGLPITLTAIAGFALVSTETSRFAHASAEVKLTTTSLDCPSLARLLLAQLGINAQVLAAIGATPEQTREIVIAARGLCEVRGGDFDAAEASVSEAQTRVSELADRVQRGFATGEEIARLTTLRQELANALDARTEVQQQVRGVINGVLSDEQVVMLDNIVAAREVTVPVYWKVEQRDDRGWIALRDGLAQARTEAREAAGTTPRVTPDRPIDPSVPSASPQDDSAQATQRAITMSDAVTLAKSRSETNRESVANAWRAALAN